MNDKQFTRLLNEYLDNVISDEDLAAFKRALRQSPQRQAIFNQYRVLHSAQRAAVSRHPRLLFFPTPLSFGRLLRDGSFLMHTALLFFAISLFHVRQPLNIDSGAFAPSAATVAPDSKSALPAKPVFSFAPADETESVYASEPAASSANAEPIDLGGIMPAEEYGFVRL
jgi:hypothetical protein